MLMTRMGRDQGQGKSAKFITYSSHPDPDPIEESLEESASVASSRESRV